MTKNEAKTVKKCLYESFMAEIDECEIHLYRKTKKLIAKTARILGFSELADKLDEFLKLEAEYDKTGDPNGDIQDKLWDLEDELEKLVE